MMREDASTMPNPEAFQGISPPTGATTGAGTARSRGRVEVTIVFAGEEHFAGIFPDALTIESFGVALSEASESLGLFPLGARSLEGTLLCEPNFVLVACGGDATLREEKCGDHGTIRPGEREDDFQYFSASSKDEASGQGRDPIASLLTWTPRPSSERTTLLLDLEAEQASAGTRTGEGREQASPLTQEQYASCEPIAQLEVLLVVRGTRILVLYGEHCTFDNRGTYSGKAKPASGLLLEHLEAASPDKFFAPSSLPRARHGPGHQPDSEEKVFLDFRRIDVRGGLEDQRLEKLRQMQLCCGLRGPSSEENSSMPGGGDVAIEAEGQEDAGAAARAATDQRRRRNGCYFSTVKLNKRFELQYVDNYENGAASEQVDHDEGQATSGRYRRPLAQLSQEEIADLLASGDVCSSFAFENYAAVVLVGYDEALWWPEDVPAAELECELGRLARYVTDGGLLFLEGRLIPSVLGERFFGKTVEKWSQSVRTSLPLRMPDGRDGLVKDPFASALYAKLFHRCEEAGVAAALAPVGVPLQAGARAHDVGRAEGGGAPRPDAVSFGLAGEVERSLYFEKNKELARRGLLAPAVVGRQEQELRRAAEEEVRKAAARARESATLYPYVLQRAYWVRAFRTPPENTLFATRAGVETRAAVDTAVEGESGSEYEGEAHSGEGPVDVADSADPEADPPPGNEDEEKEQTMAANMREGMAQNLMPVAGHGKGFLIHWEDQSSIHSVYGPYLFWCAAIRNLFTRLSELSHGDNLTVTSQFSTGM